MTEQTFCDVCGKNITKEKKEFSVSLYQDRPKLEEGELIGWDLCAKDAERVRTYLKTLQKIVDKPEVKQSG